MKRAALAVLIAGFAASGLAYAQTTDGLNEAQKELLDTQPQKKDSPDAPETTGSAPDTTVETTEMGSEAGSPASIISDNPPGDVKTTVEPGAETEMGTGAGENPDPIGGN